MLSPKFETHQTDQVENNRAIQVTGSFICIVYRYVQNNIRVLKKRESPLNFTRKTKEAIIY